MKINIKKTLILVEYIDHRVNRYLEQFNKEELKIGVLYRSSFNKDWDAIEIDSLVTNLYKDEINTDSKKIVKKITDYWNDKLVINDFSLIDYVYTLIHLDLVYSLKRIIAIELITKDCIFENVIAIDLDNRFINVVINKFNNKSITVKNIRKKINVTYFKEEIYKLFRGRITKKIIDMIFAKKINYCNKNIFWAGIRTNKTNVINQLIKNNYRFVLHENALVSSRIQILKNKGKYSIIKSVVDSDLERKMFSILPEYPKDFCFYKNIDCSILINLLMKSWVVELKRLYRVIIGLNRNEIKPNVIFLPQDYSLEYMLFSDFGKQNGIHRFVMSHGIYESNYLNPRYKSFPFHSDCIFVFGNRDKKWLIDKGIDENKILISGAPEYEYPQKNQFNKKEFILIIATHYDYYTSYHGESDYNRLLEFVIQLCRQFPKEKILLKLHPNQSESQESITKSILLKQNHNNLKITRRSNMNKILSKSKICLLHSSTVGVEALLYKCPIILTEFEVSLPAMNYDIYNKDIRKNTKEEIFCLIESMLDKDSIEMNNFEKTKSKTLEYFLEKCGYESSSYIYNQIELVTLYS